MAILRGAVGAVALALLAGCRSGPWRPEEKWNFAVTAEALDELDRDGWSVTPPDPDRCVDQHGSHRDCGYLALFIVLAPIAFDVALLPVTAPHDWWIEH